MTVENTMAQENDGRQYRVTISLTKEKFEHLRAMSEDAGIPLTQAGALCVNVGLKYLRRLISPETLFELESYKKLIADQMREESKEELSQK